MWWGIMISHMERNPKAPGHWGRGEQELWEGQGSEAGGVPLKGKEEASPPVPWFGQQAWSCCERKHLPFLLTRNHRKEIITKETVVGYGQTLRIQTSQRSFGAMGQTLGLLPEASEKRHAGPIPWGWTAAAPHWDPDSQKSLDRWF